MEGRQGQAPVPRTLTAGAGTCLLIFCITLPAAAEIYRWRDEEGRIQYGDRPPAGVPAERVDTAPAPSPSHDDSVDRRMREERVLEVLGSERRQREQVRAAERAAAKERREKCEQARRHLEETENAAYLYEPGDDPVNPRILSEAERAAHTREAERAVARWCGGS